MSRTKYHKTRYAKSKTPDKPCLRCGHDEISALKVVGKWSGGEIVLCLKCLTYNYVRHSIKSI